MKFYARLGICLTSSLFVVLTFITYLTPRQEERPAMPNGAHHSMASHRALSSAPRAPEVREQAAGGGNRQLLKSLILDMKKNMSSARWHYLTGDRPSTQGNSECTDPLCYEYLSHEDRKHFAYCLKRSAVRAETISSCHFINGSGRAPIALASFPGSGNTWVRGLLQRATGVCTGGIYCDKALRLADHPGESIRSGSVLVVKTHDPLPRWTGGTYLRFHPYMDLYGKVQNIPLFQSAILLIRNPYHALISEWNRIGTEKELDSHTSHVGKKWFGNNTDWNNFVRVKGREWRTMIESYTIHNSGHPVLVVKYEELKARPLEGLARMLDFLQQPYRKQDLEQVIKAGYTVFYRSHLDPFRHFTTEQGEFVLSEVRAAVDLLSRTDQLSRCDIRDYLNSTDVR